MRVWRRRSIDLTEAVGLQTGCELLAGCRQLEVEVFEACGEACTRAAVTFDFGCRGRGGGGHVSVNTSQFLAVRVGGRLPWSAHAQFRLHMFSAKRFQLFFRTEERQRAWLDRARPCVSVSWLMLSLIDNLGGRSEGRAPGGDRGRFC